MERLRAIISTILALLTIMRQAHETHGNTGCLPTEHPPLQHPELEVLHQSSRMALFPVGKAPENPVPAARGALTFPVTFSIRGSGHCPRAEHPPPAPGERGRSSRGKTGSLLLSPAPPGPQRSPAPPGSCRDPSKAGKSRLVSQISARGTARAPVLPVSIP